MACSPDDVVPGFAPGRILIGLTEISGYACNLRAGLAELGVDADVLDLQPGTFRFGDDVPPTRVTKLLQRVSRARLAAHRSSPRRRALATLQVALTPLVLAQAVVRYRSFVFLYDTSFARQWELPLLRRLGKRLVYVHCGSDDRPTYLDGGLMAAPDASVDWCIASVQRKKRTLRRIERSATALVTNPSHGLLHEQPFAIFPLIGIPRVVPDLEPVRPRQPPVVVHAPSHPQAKGTAVIRETVARLQEAGHEFEYVELTDVPNAVLREHLRTCAFVVDQVWADTPMDGLVADAALYSKPAVVSGESWAALRELLPADAFPPSELCEPDGLGAAMALLLRDEPYRLELGARARAFVEERWSARVVARRILELLAGRPKPEWLCDPAGLPLFLGWGQPAERSLALVRELIERGGVSALGLDDKPAAAVALVELARCSKRPLPAEGPRAA